jgi:hypothetical protein
MWLLQWLGLGCGLGFKVISYKVLDLLFCLSLSPVVCPVYSIGAEVRATASAMRIQRSRSNPHRLLGI